MSIDIDQRDPVELLGEEFLELWRQGDEPTIEQFAEAHPNHAERIRQLFPAMMTLERFKSDRLSGSQATLDPTTDCPEQLGDFHIKFEIGRGGMGIVYEAEQQSLRRRVALKVFPKETLLNPRQLKRFHREARTAARLHHTNIVPVFGVGDQDGLHYYVMQRIHGFGLDSFIRDVGERRDHASDNGKCVGNDQRTVSRGKSATQLAVDTADNILRHNELKPHKDTATSPNSLAGLAEIRQRKRESYWRRVAQIGVQVADALDYAHGQGVVHRDIKPGNLIRDSQGTVWVTDFGLATAVEAERLSNPGDVVGTLRFMAPEALTGTSDARSDIYSLGVTLYELLTLCPAFDEPSRQQLAGCILDGDYSRPRRINRQIPKDVEAITVKAMHRDPRRRYQSAAELSYDLHRFLEDRPVRARAIGMVGRLLRWTRRNPLIGGLSAALIIVVVASLIGISGKWREAVAENRRAEDNLVLALESMDQILERFASSWMAHPTASPEDEQSGGMPPIEYQMEVSDYSAQVLQDALRFYERFAKQNSANPKLQLDTAKVHRRVGDIYERLGQWPKAEEAYLRALKILNNSSVDPTHVIEQAVTLNQLGLAKRTTGGFGNATNEFQLARQLLANSKAARSPVFRYELARTNINLGQSLSFSPRRSEAGDRYRESVELLLGLTHEYPEEVDYRLALARAYRAYYPLVAFRRHDTDADRIRADGVALLEQLVADFPSVPDYRCELSEMLLTTSRRWRGATASNVSTESLQRAVDLARRTSREHPAIPRYRAVLARALKEQAQRTAHSHRDSADDIFAESIVEYRSLAESYPDNPAYFMFLATALEDRGTNLSALRRDTDACLVYRDAIGWQEEYLRLRPDSRFGKGTLLRQYKTLATVLRKLDRDTEADAAKEQARTLRAELSPERKHRSS